jgi:hypothetical protein
MLHVSVTWIAVVLSRIVERNKQSTKHGKNSRFQIELLITPYNTCGHYFIDSQASIEYLYLTEAGFY